MVEWQRRRSASRTVCLCLSWNGSFSRITAGLTYCAIGALTFLNRLSRDASPGRLLSPAAPEFGSLVRWLVSRQTTDLGEASEDAEESLHEPAQEGSLHDRIQQLPNIPPPDEASLRWAGFNGRANKAADTCYSFWNTGTLAVGSPPIAKMSTDRKDDGQTTAGGFRSRPKVPPGEDTACYRGVWQGCWGTPRYDCRGLKID